MRNEAASKYSNALFSLGKEKENLMELKDSLAEFWQIVEENKDLKQVLFHHCILSEEKKNIISKLFGDQLQQDILHFIYILIEKRREYQLESIISSFNQLVDREENILNVEVTSAVKMKQSALNKLKNRLKEILDKNIRINNIVNENIIGGLVLKVEDYIIDGSLIFELKNLEQKIKGIPVSKLGVN
ncbi:MAG: ATP synthase F1 subunit delta [Halanaerobium sp.]